MMNRHIENFNSDWKFSKLPKDGAVRADAAVKPSFSDEDWEALTLPHTWNSSDGVSGWTGICEGGEHYYRGLACYRKKAFLSQNKYCGKQLYLEFGAANTVAELYVNGQYVGRHEGAYSLFRFDITDFVCLDSENLFAVTVNNAPTDYIAPITDQGDFTKMGGLYRDVRLITVNPLHIDLMDFGSSGIYITPKAITEKSADVEFLIKLANRCEVEKTVQITAEIMNADGICVANCDTQTSISGNDTASITLSAQISQPILWNGIENPNLYSARIVLRTDGTVLDESLQTFGIRSYSIKWEDGFFLNGEYLDLRGANYHQDSYENGWAMTDEQRERDYKIMLDMGCTAVRMAHYQHAPYEYDLCDRLGICVWTELGIVNKMSADPSENLTVTEGFVENAKQQLTELIRQNYNHPSIIVWGISNELYQMNDTIYKIYEELHALANKEDTTRLKTFADNQTWGRFLELPADVIGYNRYFGWYHDAGPIWKFGEWLDICHTQTESRPICVSEYGAGAATSQHKDYIDWQTEIDPWGKRHYENYQSAVHEQIWAQFSARRYLWAKFIWCMFDFASDGREEGDTVGQNDKGLLTRKRVPKDSFYFYKSVWNPEPMVHITQKRFSPRPCLIPQIKVYSNAARCELFVNGVSQGRKDKTDLPDELQTVFTWENIRLSCDTENEVTACASFPDGTVLEDKVYWTGILNLNEEEDKCIRQTTTDMKR